MPRPRAWIASLTFSDETTVEFTADDIVVVVGPNNSGKSVALKAIQAKAGQEGAPSPVIKELVLARDGSAEELAAWIKQVAVRNAGSVEDPSYSALGATVHESQFAPSWDGSRALGPLLRFFIHLLSADERLSAANPASQIRLAEEAPSHPLHYLQRDEGLEEKISAKFRIAFGEDLVLHRNAGSEVPLLVGERPQPGPGEDRLSLSYMEKLGAMPGLHTQGDGMRSFTGVLLHTAVGPETVLLIDEPEAFLHPPQARLLGRQLLADRPAGRQLFIATHSGDVLRGMLDSGDPNIRVLRIQRDGKVNPVSTLPNDQVAELWKDPLLRYSNILDGLFHEVVVVCESDSDCRFYSAILDAVSVAGGSESPRPAVMFTHCGGKARIPVVVKALRELDVPVRVVTDFDVMNDEHPLREIAEASGVTWSEIEADFRSVKTAIESKKPELASEEVTKEIRGILDNVADPIFPKGAKKRIQSILRRSSPWSAAKTVGRGAVPSGDPTQAFDRLNGRLRSAGVFIVEVGELEGFDKSVGGHGPKWVNEVLQKDLGGVPELENARRFVTAVFQITSGGGSAA